MRAVIIKDLFHRKKDKRRHTKELPDPIHDVTHIALNQKWVRLAFFFFLRADELFGVEGIFKEKFIFVFRSATFAFPLFWASE